jgi:hypothetical protein
MFTLISIWHSFSRIYDDDDGNVHFISVVVVVVVVACKQKNLNKGKPKIGSFEIELRGQLMSQHIFTQAN